MANDTSNLTDQDRHLSETFIHNGKVQRAMDEECAKLDKKHDGACQGNGKTKFAGMDSGQVKMIAKMYTMIIGMMDLGGIPKSEGTLASQTKAADKAGEEKPDKEMKDNCKFIPMATEIIAQFKQTSEQTNLANLPENQTTAQKESLFKAARSHEQRSENHKIQAMGFTAGGACYAMMMIQASLTDPQIWLKVGASSFLAAFYWSEVDKHKKIAEELRRIANKLPGAGDCNPITERNCYCSQPETQYDPKYCLPNVLAKRKPKPGFIPVTCIDINMKPDPECKCTSTNTCFDQKFLGDIKITAPGNALATTRFKPIRDLARGNLSSGDLAGTGAGRNAVRKLLGDIKGKIPDGLGGVVTSNDQKKEFDSLKGLGFPPRLASLIATTKAPAGSDKNIARFRGANRIAAYNKRGKRYGKSKVLSFRGGRGLGGKKKRNKKGKFNPFALKKKGKKSSKGNILRFGAKAAASAEIRKDSETSIFRVLSLTYQKKWKDLEADF